MKLPGYLMIYNLKLFLLLILYQFIDDLVAWVVIGRYTDGSVLYKIHLVFIYHKIKIRI